MDTRKFRRGRPSKAGGQAIDARVLDAAWQAFVASGYENTTMEAIAEAAGVTKTTLYLRHASKADLLRATVQDRIARWSRESSLNDWLLGDTLEDRLVYLGATVLGRSRHPEVLGTRYLVNGTRGEAEIIANELDRAIRRPFLDQLETEIAGMTARDGQPVGNPRAIARMFVGMLEALADRFEDVSEDPARDAAVARHVVAVLFGGRSAW